MPGYYTYLISSLPLLRFGARTPFSFAKFLQICAELLSRPDLKILQGLCVSGDYTEAAASSAVFKKWQRFDTCLRNELATIRAERRHLDPARYLRGEKCYDPFIARIAITAYRAAALLEAEMLLDEQRWRALDTFNFGHYFDLECLVVYALKLLILERWDKINSADKLALLEQAASSN